MDAQEPVYYTSVEKCVDDILNEVGNNIVFGMPLALGKPTHLVNSLYLRAKNNPEINLTIMTALSLEKPIPSSELESRLLTPLTERIWDGVLDFEYVKDLRTNSLPDNITIKEFFTKAGSYLNVPHTQQNYISSNYTHIVRDLLDNGINVLGTLMCKKEENGETLYSLSCNSDLPLEAMERLTLERKKGRKFIIIGQTNSNLPFMYGDAVVTPESYDFIIENEELDFPLFNVPKAAVVTPDHMIGLHVSTLVKDGGSLQIGIGSLGDAIANGLVMRHSHNRDYTKLMEDLDIENEYGELVRRIGGSGIFRKGIYGTTEMLVEVFIKLYEAGILKRKVYGHPELQRLLNQEIIEDKVSSVTLDALIEDKVINPVLTEDDFNFLQHYGIFREDLSYGKDRILNGTKNFSTDLNDSENRLRVNRYCLGEEMKNGALCHGAFFIGSNEFYASLNSMSEEERKQFSMTGVQYVNQLYGDEKLKSLQRKEGRFVNAAMMVTLLGAVVSDGLENGSVVSGVGGQYNFVSMAHALEDGRLIMMVRSTKTKNGKASSNIVFNYGHTTIPRHMRDIVVTEYGIADLRGKSDKEVICSMLNISDSRFQEELLEKAKASGKVPADYQIPEKYKNNLPEKLEEKLAPFRAKGYFSAFPFGCDFTEEEIVLGKSLRKFKEKASTSKLSVLPGILKHFLGQVPEENKPYVERMGLMEPSDFREKLMRAVVSSAVTDTLCD